MRARFSGQSSWTEPTTRSASTRHWPALGQTGNSEALTGFGMDLGRRDTDDGAGPEGLRSPSQLASKFLLPSRIRPFYAVQQLAGERQTLISRETQGVSDAALSLRMETSVQYSVEASAFFGWHVVEAVFLFNDDDAEDRPLGEVRRLINDDATVLDVGLEREDRVRITQIRRKDKPPGR